LVGFMCEVPCSFLPSFLPLLKTWNHLQLPRLQLVVTSTNTNCVWLTVVTWDAYLGEGKKQLHMTWSWYFVGWEKHSGKSWTEPNPNQGCLFWALIQWPVNLLKSTPCEVSNLGNMVPILGY
jgi:hypothetical protein